MSKKPKIHFILPAGGVRGAFQAGFLHQLFQEHNEYFSIARIDGTSVGALNGFAIINNKIDTLKKIWFNIESINDLFSSWSNSYILPDYLSYYHGFYKGGLFSNEKLHKLIKDTSETIWDSLSEDYKNKYSCAVVNIGTAKSKYVKGSDTNIIDYIVASASPWVISNPVKIEDELYADGGLLETYPIEFIDKCDADITLILGYDQEHFNFISRENDNILTYLANLIDISLPNLSLSVPTYYVVAPAECSSNLSRFDGVKFGRRSEDPKDLEELYIKSRSEGFGDEVKRRILIGSYVLSAGYYDAYYKKAQQVRRLIKNDFDKAFSNIDVIMTPTTRGPAFEMGSKGNDPIQMYLEDLFTISANLAGLPAISIPNGNIDNKPTGIQIIGNFLDESSILNFAHMFQTSTNWHKYTPEGVKE